MNWPCAHNINNTYKYKAQKDSMFYAQQDTVWYSVYQEL